jgi:hypothetical protein
MRRMLLNPLSISIAVLGGLGCSDAGIDSSPGGEVVVGIGEELFPSDALTDLVSYAAQVSQVTVLAENEIVPPASVVTNQEGYIGRKVSVHVDKTFWTSQGAIDPGATSDPVDFEIVVSGWVVRAGKRVLFALKDSPRIEVNGKYVLPLTTYLRPVLANPAPITMSRQSGSTPDALEVQWGPLSTRCVFQANGDPIATADVRARGNNEVARSLSQLAEADIAGALAGALPYPIAAENWSLPPYERWLVVSAGQ